MDSKRDMRILFAGFVYFVVVPLVLVVVFLYSDALVVPRKQASGRSFIHW